MVGLKEIQGLAERIARKFRPERIILFGSYAEGKPTADSDVDLLVLLPHAGKSWRMAAQIRTHVQADFPLDLLVRAPEEMRRKVAAGDPFLRAIADKGIVLCARDREGMG